MIIAAQTSNPARAPLALYLRRAPHSLAPSFAPPLALSLRRAPHSLAPFLAPPLAQLVPLPETGCALLHD
eukprot:4170322-Prymnesium_polylepis.1